MSEDDITHILIRGGTEGALSRPDADRVFAAAYGELRSIADSEMRNERGDHTLQPTALINETYLRLVDQSRIAWESRAHFFGIAARAMRQVLIEHARRRGAVKRGGDRERVHLHDQSLFSEDRDIDAIELEQALAKLARRNERMARVVELRVFAGLTGQEIAQGLGVSRKTIVDDWRVAAMWLRAELAGEGSL